MITFLSILEAMERDQKVRSPLMDSGEESKGLSVIRSGKSLHNDDSFWEDFISLCGNTEGMAELLNVRPEQVNSWPSKIRSAIHSVEKHDMQGESKPEEDQELMPTGQNGAVTSQNMGPYGLK